MTKEEIFQLMNENPAFHLATEEDGQPRVRGMLLYRADENGIIFHTASCKDVFKQIQKNPRVEMCFFGKGVQVRVTGVLKHLEDESLKAEIFAHPTRKFLQAWKEMGVDDMLEVFCLKGGEAVTWTMETNFNEKEPVQL
ncbi:MAG: pyridoxamine 5'-phosphate oxidase family protein [Clostridiales bacterium]|nr:pyridoxamine 5'-phosphate oxidase family protein [Clostridiales bacterium]